jgi:hypothetical protein
MSNENQGRSKEKMERDEKITTFAVWGLIITVLTLLALRVFYII